MATRAAQALLTPEQALAFVVERGIVCESSRRGTIASLADAVVGAPIAGNWWSHPHAREIFAATRFVREQPELLTCRLVDGKITFVHERLWAALVRIADRFPGDRLARLREVHTESGRHLVKTIAFPDWVSIKAKTAAARMSDAEAIQALSHLLKVAI